MPAGDVSFVACALLSDASGGQHPAICSDGQTWNPFGQVQLATSEVSADVVVAAGATVAVISATALFAGLANVVEVDLSLPGVEFSAAPGGECTFSVTVAGTPYLLGHLAVRGPFSWPARLSRQFPAPGAGAFTFAVSCRSLSQPVVVHADTGAAFGPVVMSISVLG
jgi:hypothetical protein